MLLNSTERTFMNESVSYLNQVAKNAALSEGVQFMDIGKSLDGHELCGRTSSVAMNAIRLGDDIAPLSFLKKFYIVGSESFHPTPIGHQMAATNIINEYPSSNLISACEDCVGDLQVPNLPAYWNNYSQDQYARQIYEPLLTKTAITLKDIIAIAAPAHLFAPRTEVKAEIHSEPIELGRGISEQDGSYNLEASIPDWLQPGYHTIHLLGVAPDGKPIDVYNVIAVESDKAIPVVSDATNNLNEEKMFSSSTNNNESDTTQARVKATSFDTTATFKTPSDNLAVLGATARENSLVNPLVDTTKNNTAVKQHFIAVIFISLLGLLAVADLISVILFANLSRQSSRESSG